MSPIIQPDENKNWIYMQAKKSITFLSDPQFLGQMHGHH